MWSPTAQVHREHGGERWMAEGLWGNLYSWLWSSTLSIVLCRSWHLLVRLTRLLVVPFLLFGAVISPFPVFCSFSVCHHPTPLSSTCSTTAVLLSFVVCLVLDLKVHWKQQLVQILGAFSSLNLSEAVLFRCYSLCTIQVVLYSI